MPRYRHIVCLANQQLWAWFPSKDRLAGLHIFAALHQGNYATIPNYLERYLRYMDAGDEAQERQLGHRGPGYQ